MIPRGILFNILFSNSHMTVKNTMITLLSSEKNQIKQLEYNKI